MRIICRALALLLFALPALADDVAEARKVFEGNLGAIHAHDRAKYLSYYLHSERLVRGGPTGFSTGYDDFAKGAGSAWPDLIEGSDLHLTPLQPGLVYGTYRYRVRYGADEHSGISERLFVKTPDGWKIAVTGAVDTPPGTPAPPRAIVGATLIDGRGGAPVPNATIVMRDGKIDCAGACKVPEGIDVVDGKGMWVAPGLIDAHVHFSQTGWADGRPDSIDVRGTHPYEQTIAENRRDPERYGRAYVCSGVTSVWDVGGYTWTLGLRDRFENNTSVPHVEAAGPLLSTLDHWLNLPAERQFMVLNDEKSAREEVKYLAAQGTSAVKVWWIVNPPDLTVEKLAPAVAAAADEAHKNKLPLIVHATGLAEAKAALRAGANVLVHNVDDLPVDDEFIDLAKKNDAILIPTLTVVGGYGRMMHGVADRKPPAVDDPNGCVDRATLAKVAETAALDASLVPAARLERMDGRIARIAAVSTANLKKLVDAGVSIATGTDAGNPLTLHGPAIYAEMEAMQKSGMTPMQVIVSSTAVAARAMGHAARAGTIEKGKDADLVLVAGDPSSDVANFRKVRYVVRSGVVRSIDDLHALAQNPQK
jgi:imidazolonepropionase-like amidohydrolase